MPTPEQNTSDNWKSHIPTIVIGIIIAFATLVVSVAWDKYSSQKKHLDYSILSSGNLNNVIGERNILKINDIEVNNAGLIDVTLFNKTDTDFDSLTVEMKLLNRLKAPIKPISIDYQDINGFKDRIKYSNIQEKHIFKITPTNRDSRAIMKVTFIVEDIENTVCVLDVKKAGLEPRHIELDSNENLLRKQELVRNILVVVMFLAIILLITVYRSGRRRRQINVLLLRHLEEMQQENEKRINSLNKNEQ